MKRLILAAGLLVAAASTSLYAQTMAVQASIPFDFRIDRTSLPSGEYLFRHSGGVLVVRQIDGHHKSGMFVAVAGDRLAGSTPQDTLQFTRYGDTYYLSKIWTRQTDAVAPVKSAREKELARHIGLSGTATVSLRAK
jgi:hypothetical protein